MGCEWGTEREKEREEKRDDSRLHAFPHPEWDGNGMRGKDMAREGLVAWKSQLHSILLTPSFHSLPFILHFIIPKNRDEWRTGVEQRWVFLLDYLFGFFFLIKFLLFAFLMKSYYFFYYCLFVNLLFRKDYNYISHLHLSLFVFAISLVFSIIHFVPIILFLYFHYLFL